MNCLAKECTRKVVTRSMCRPHYQQWRKGKLDVTPPPPADHATAGRLGGSKGAKDGARKGFAVMPKEKVSAAGRKGGAISRRDYGKSKATDNERKQSATLPVRDREYLALPGTKAADIEKDEELDEVAEQALKAVMSYEQPKSSSFFDRFKKARA